MNEQREEVKDREKKKSKIKTRRDGEKEDKRAPIQGTSRDLEGSIRMHLRPHLLPPPSTPTPFPHPSRPKGKCTGNGPHPLAPPSFSGSRNQNEKDRGERATGRIEETS